MKIVYRIKQNTKLYLGVLIASAGLLGACSQSNSKQLDNDSGEGKAQPEVVGMKMSGSIIQKLNPDYSISLPAELHPYEQVSVHAKVSGFIKQIFANRGDYVKKGQLLATLEAPELEQQYLRDKSNEQKANNDYVYAKQAYDRLVDASNTAGAVAEIELDRAKSAMESAYSSFKAAQAQTQHSSQLKEYLRIVAPFDGIITQRNVSVGALSGASSEIPIFFIAQNDKLRLTLSVPEKHASSVQPASVASFTVSSQPGEEFDAKLSRSSGMLSQGDRSLTLEFDVDNSDGVLQGGDYAQVKLQLKRRKASLWVDNNSILKSQSGTYLLTVKEGELKKVAIHEGVRLDSITEVFGNFANGDTIILKPSEEMNEGPIDLVNLTF